MDLLKGQLKYGNHGYPDLSEEDGKTKTETWLIGLISSLFFLLSPEDGSRI